VAGASAHAGEAPQAIGPEVVDATVRATLHQLRDLIRRHQYDTVLQVHCHELAPRRLEASLRETLARAPEATQTLLRLLYLGDTVERRSVASVLGADLLTALEALDVLGAMPAPGGVASRYRLDVMADTLLLIPSQGLDATGVYFGEDSQFLRSQLSPRHGDVCLDLCTGSGVQALRLAPLAARVDGVDLNPAAVRLAAMNAVLNELDDRVRVYQGDLWEPFPAATQWDYVVSNPPLVPVPEGVKFPLSGHGGADGLEIVRRILTALPERLSPRGRCVLIGACTGDAATPTVVAEARELLAGSMNVVAFQLLKVPLRDWALLVADTVRRVYPGVSTGKTIAACRARYGAAFDATFVYTYLLKVEREGAPGCRVFDYATVGARSYWFVNRGRAAP